MIKHDVFSTRLVKEKVRLREFVVHAASTLCLLFLTKKSETTHYKTKKRYGHKENDMSFKRVSFFSFCVLVCGWFDAFVVSYFVFVASNFPIKKMPHQI